MLTNKFFLLLSILFLGVLKGEIFAQKNKPNYVVMVSFDGFRYDYVERYQAPNFKKIIAEGTQAQGLIPIYPSKTFPNHYSIVTGMYAENHGIIDNTFYNKATQQTYQISDKKQVQNANWYQGVPLWQYAQQQGLKTASFFWVGSEAPVTGSFPTYYYQYDAAFPNQKRIEKVIEWLQLPENERPQLITLYFSDVDTQGHRFGAESEEVKTAVLNMDTLIGQLWEKLKKMPYDIDLIIVSDHGMQTLENPQKEHIMIEDLANLSNPNINIVSNLLQTHIYINEPDSVEKIYQDIKAKEQNFWVYKKADIPDSLHYKKHPCIGDILIIAKPNYVLLTDNQAKQMQKGKMSIGQHGYPASTSPNMQGIFYAVGKDIRKGLTINAFENIHIYPLVCHLLGIPIPTIIDGQWNVLKPIIK